MELKQVVKTIERQYPKEEAMEWDNVGLLAGRMQKDVKRIYVAVDATDEVIEDARCAEADLLVTHHPLIFGGMKRITDEDFIGRRLVKLLREDIACYAMAYELRCTSDGTTLCRSFRTGRAEGVGSDKRGSRSRDWQYRVFEGSYAFKRLL